MESFNKLEKKTHKKPERINLICIIFVCYLVSFFSNISFFFIFILSEYIYKWFGIIFILVEIILLQISIKRIKNLSEYNFKFFRQISTLLMMTLLFNCLFFLVIVIYIIAKKVAKDLMAIFIFCCFVWIVFHALFVSILKYYITHKKFNKRKTSSDFNI